MTKKEKNLMINKNNFEKKSKKDKICLFQTPMDYYFLLISKSIIFENKINLNFIGSWPYYFKPFKKNSFMFSVVNIFKNKIFFFFLKKKWTKIYKILEINKLYDFSEFSFRGFAFAVKNFSVIFNNINSKEALLKIKLEEIYIGDLVYDTYIRYRQVPTVDISDIYLKFIIFKTLIIFKNIKNFIKDKEIEYYFTSYTSYINHGLIARYFVSKKIKVYTFPKQHIQNFCEKVNSKKYYAGIKNSDLIYQKFLKEKNKKKIISLGKAKLELRFQGKKEEGSSYMIIPSYKKNNFEKKIFLHDGVLFLHDFYDAPREAGIRMFNDYYEWTEFVIKVIVNNQLNIAVKFHPNSKPESIKFNDFLKKKYRNITFLSKDYSNINIFKSKKFKVGISVSGSVLYELLYFSKVPLYLTKNLVSPLNIVPMAKTKKEYENLIINFKKIKIKKKYKDIMMGMYFLLLNDDKSDLNCELAKKIKLKDLDSNNLGNLEFFNNELKKEILKKKYF